MTLFPVDTVLLLFEEVTASPPPNSVFQGGCSFSSRREMGSCLLTWVDCLAWPVYELLWARRPSPRETSLVSDKADP